MGGSRDSFLLLTCSLLAQQQQQWFLWACVDRTNPDTDSDSNPDLLTRVNSVNGAIELS